MAGVSFPLKQSQGTLSASIWGTGGIWHCAGCSCTRSSWFVPHWPSQTMLWHECCPVPAGLGGLKALSPVLSRSAQCDLLTHSVPWGFLVADCLSPRRQWARSPHNITLQLQDTGAVSLFCICSTWEVNLRCKKRSWVEEVLWWVPFLGTNWDQWCVQKKSLALLPCNTVAEVASSLAIYWSILAESFTELIGREAGAIKNTN